MDITDIFWIQILYRMLKKLVDKKIKSFKKAFPDYKVSAKTGSLYSKLGVKESTKEVLTTGASITKNTLDRLGEIKRFKTHRADIIFLISPKGKLMYSTGGNYQLVTLKTLYNIPSDYRDRILDTFFIGKKYEWIKGYDNIWRYRFFQSFGSLKEAKIFLGYEFLSNNDFYSMFSEEWRKHNFDAIILAKDKTKAFKLLRNPERKTLELLDDYISLCYTNNIEPIITAGKNSLEEEHDRLVWEISKKEAENYSKEQRYFAEGTDLLTSIWRERGLNFRRINTPFEMYLQGSKQRHCLGTNYYSTLNNYSFYTFTYEEDEYDLQLHKNGKIGQFYGFRNKDVPRELRTKVIYDIAENVFRHNIIDMNPNLKNYPKKGGSNNDFFF